MPTTLNILIASSDPKLHSEVDDALNSADDVVGVTHQASSFREALQLARTRTPGLVIVELTSDVAALEGFAKELSVESPNTTVAAVFRADAFGPDVSESAVLIPALRSGVKDFLRRPISSTELGELISRIQQPAVGGPVQSGSIVSFISNKGGVGKSTVAVNVACGVAQRYPDEVLLVDASLQMGVCASMMDLQPRTTITDAVRERDRLDESLLRQLAIRHSSGTHLLAAPSDAVEAAEVDDDIMSHILTLARRCYRFVVVDTFPMLDRVIVAVLDMSDRTYVVCENVVPTLLGAAKLVQVLEGLGFPSERRRVVLNRFTRNTGGLSPEDVAERLGQEVDHVLPYDRKTVMAANTGVPNVLQASRFFGFGRRIRSLVHEVSELSPVGVRVNGEAHRNGRSSVSASVQPAPTPDQPTTDSSVENQPTMRNNGGVGDE